MQLNRQQSLEIKCVMLASANVATSRDEEQTIEVL